ncbi:hypothetical protein IJ384_05250 [bacterium]|nr:hypothetical protein [bacterium]
MNKIQIKAEILATLRALASSTMPDPSLLTDLKKIEDKKTVFDVLVRELVSCDEHKSLIICWLLTELIEKSTLNDELWNIIKSPDYTDNVKLVAFNMLKDLGNKIDYEVISGYFEKFNELINKETKELLETAIMNPEAQIDFMDFLNALTDNDKITLIKSLEEDYANDALANILIPVYLFYMGTEVGDIALEILGRTKSQLAFHALENVKKHVEQSVQAKVNKAISELKLSGVRVDNTIEFYKMILKESKPYKSYISFPDGHGNLAIIFSRIRPNKTLQFLAIVISPQYGVLDAFGFNSMTERDFYKIVDKFYNYQEKYEISPEIVKFLLERSVEKSYENKDPLPYEYICWESIILDIESIHPVIDLDKKELNQKDIDKLCLNSYVQNWFYDEITSPGFKTFIEKLSNEFKEHKFDVDLDKFLAENFDIVFTQEEIDLQQKVFNMSAYLRLLKGDEELAQMFYSLGSNYAFLSNILRKSIYEYYVGKRYLLKNQRKVSNKFEQRMQPNTSDFELLQLDMIISSIEAKWVDNA